MASAYMASSSAVSTAPEGAEDLEVLRQGRIAWNEAQAAARAQAAETPWPPEPRPLGEQLQSQQQQQQLDYWQRQRQEQTPPPAPSPAEPTQSWAARHWTPPWSSTGWGAQSWAGAGAEAAGGWGAWTAPAWTPWPSPAAAEPPAAGAWPPWMASADHMAGSGKGAGKGDYSDPPAWPGWQHFRLWKKSLARWDAATDVAVRRRSEKVLKLFDWDMQARFEHLSDAVLTSDKYLEAMMQVLEGLSGEKAGDEQRRALKGGVYDTDRRKDETLSQFVLRRQKPRTSG